MNTKTMVAGLAIGSLLIGAGINAVQSVRAETDAIPTVQSREMSGWHADFHSAMASMMWMMHQHLGMMGDGMMGHGMMGHGMMGDGMMGDDSEAMMGDGMMGDDMMGDDMMGDDSEAMTGDDSEAMMGATPLPEATTAPPSTGPSTETPAPDASLGAGPEQHHLTASPVASPEPS